MGIVQKLAAVALGPVFRGACERAGLQVAGDAGEAAVKALTEHFRDHSHRLVKALEEANGRAWRALELTLAGDSWWERCRVLLAPGDYQAFRKQVQAFLEATPLAGLPGHPPEFREQCLRELRAARKTGLFTAGRLDPNEVAAQARPLLRFADPAGILDAEWQALAQVAEELRQAHFPALAHLVALRPGDGRPLLAVAVGYFFRREVETDAQLFQGLAHAQLEHLGEGQERAFADLAEGLARHGDRLEEVLDEVRGAVVETHGAVLDVRQELLGQRDDIRALGEAVDRLLQEHQLQRRELRPHDSLSVHGDAERQLVRQVVAEYRRLPEEQRRRLPALLNAVGKLQVVAGDFAAAGQDFRTLAAMAPQADARAEAHYHAYRTALEAGAWPDALRELQAAVRLDAGRFAPFPVDKYEPERILGAGGFGVAFLCRHRNSGSQVVVKALLADDLERDVGLVFAEARVLEELHHPGIIRLRDCDYADPAGKARPFLVMDYFDGTTLEDYVGRHGPLPAAEFIAVAFPAAEALRAAHRRGILHRDVKPANLLVRRDADGWEVKVIDFGLALRPAALLSGAARGGRAGASVVGRSIAGTLGYAAPEQMGRVRGVPVGPYSDVYGFGKTCCYALFGTAQPLPKHWGRARPGLASLVEGCLAEAPAERPADFSRVLDRLRVERLKLAGMNDEELPEARPLVLPRRLAARPEPAVMKAVLVAEAVGAPAAVADAGPAPPQPDAPRYPVAIPVKAPRRPRPRGVPGRVRLALAVAGLVAGVAFAVLGVVLLRAALGSADGSLIPFGRPLALAPADEPGPVVPPPPVVNLFDRSPRVYLADLQEFGVRSGPWPFTKDGTIGNGSTTVRVQGVLSPHGLGMHPPSAPGYASARYRLGKQAAVFLAVAAIDDSSNWCWSPGTFAVRGDGKLLWRSQPLSQTGPRSQPCRVDVSGVDVLELRVWCGNGYNGVHAVWSEPRLLQKADTPDQDPPAPRPKPPPKTEDPANVRKGTGN